MHALKPRIPETPCEGVKRESTLACVHKASISWEGAQIAANKEDAGVFLQCEHPDIITSQQKLIFFLFLRAGLGVYITGISGYVVTSICCFVVCVFMLLIFT